MYRTKLIFFIEYALYSVLMFILYSTNIKKIHAKKRKIILNAHV